MTGPGVDRGDRRRPGLGASTRRGIHGDRRTRADRSAETGVPAQGHPLLGEAADLGLQGLEVGSDQPGGLDALEADLARTFSVRSLRRPATSWRSASSSSRSDPLHLAAQHQFQRQRELAAGGLVALAFELGGAAALELAPGARLLDLGHGPRDGDLGRFPRGHGGLLPGLLGDPLGRLPGCLVGGLPGGTAGGEGRGLDQPVEVVPAHPAVTGARGAAGAEHRRRPQQRRPQPDDDPD